MPIANARLVALSVALVSCTVGSSAPPDGGLGWGDAGHAAIELVLEPAEVDLESVDGSTPRADFFAKARTIDGELVRVTPTELRVSHDRIGTIDLNGTFTASGRAGGTVEVIATYPGVRTQLVARATVRVRLDVTAPTSVPATVVERFGTLPEEDDPFLAATVIYPFEGARMPNNIASPDVQWHPIGSDGDAFRMTMTTEHATVRSFVVDDGPSFGSHLALEPNAFRIIADTALGSDVQVRVDRLPAGQDRVIRGYPVTFWLSEDGIFGTVYYWQVRTAPEASDVLRLDTVSGERASVFETGTATCAGCHALSQDGRSLSATLGGSAPWSTAVVDAASGSSPPPDVLGPFAPAYNLFAWSPFGDRILASRALATTDRSDTRLSLLDATDGSELAVTGLPTGRAGYPAWSPDGTMVAWMEGGGDGPEGTEGRTQIVIADVGDADTFAPRILHDGGAVDAAPEGGLTDSRPTFSPDSRFVAFAHGTRSVSSRTISGARPRASLYLVPSAGGAAVRLERGMGPEGATHAFWPVFSPFATQEADGTTLYWLAFYSRMAYGNEHAGTLGSGRRQLWVMAIDPERAARGEDPSHPPYWLPGQDTHADDIAAMWAPTACRGRGESCAASSECCSGECAAADPAEPDVLTCQPPRACRPYGESCERSDDCCEGAECNLGVCGYEPPV